MNDRPTPETDANECWPASNLKLGKSSVVPSNVTRKLERERDEARSMTEHQWLLKVGSRLCVAGCKSDGILDSIDEIIRERDEAREECKILVEKLDGIKRLCDKVEEKADWFREKAGQHLDERDEARKTAERYRLEANAMMLQRDEAIEKAKRYEEYS